MQETENNIGKPAHGALQGLHEPSLSELAPFSKSSNTDYLRILSAATLSVHRSHDNEEKYVV